MASRVVAKAPEQELKVRPVVFNVRRNGAKFGELHVNKLGLRWWGYHDKKAELIKWSDLERRLSR